MIMATIRLNRDVIVTLETISESEARMTVVAFGSVRDEVVPMDEVVRKLEEISF